MHESLSQPLKCSPITPHEAPEIAKLQAASYVGELGETLPLELAYNRLRCDEKVVSFLGFEGLCGARLTLVKCLHCSTPYSWYTSASQSPVRPCQKDSYYKCFVDLSVVYNDIMI